MKKKAMWLVAVTLTVCGLFFYHQTYFSYKTLKDLHCFPVPKSAKLVDKSNIAYGFNWSRAKEESDIPFGYKFILARNGWEEVKGNGSMMKFTNGKHHIAIICTNKYLKILLGT